MINSVAQFIHYFGGVRRRTLNFIAAVPDDKLDWSPALGEMTFAELIRHISAAEAMFVGAVSGGRWYYAGHTAATPAEREPLLTEFNHTHEAAMTQLRQLPDAALTDERPSLEGPQVKIWRLLMAMSEHEIHHRSQMAMYLTLIQVKAPHIYGLGVEDVIARATG
ncbi:MAG: DinB family protein [Anaerolineae bacterium]|nr:DinB family protein [Anaerolineae bacterium]